MSHPSKSWLLLALPLAIVFALEAFVVVPWMRLCDLQSRTLTVLFHISSTVWMVILLVAACQLSFQLAALFLRPAPPAAAPGDPPPVKFLLLYVTCDDFRPEAIERCLAQTYPATHFRIVIADDSREASFRYQIDGVERTWGAGGASGRVSLTVVRRADRRGFKAGNVNDALAVAGSDVDWVVLIDADQLLPVDYLDNMARAVEGAPPEIAFVQGLHQSDALVARGGESTRFQRVLGTEIAIFYNRDLPCRQRYGFVPFLGHGAAFRVDAWREVKGFPEIVSEDYGFAFQLAGRGYRGLVAPHVTSWEAFPKDFGAFAVRAQKFSAGTGELVLRELPTFLGSPLTRVEKCDCMLMLAWYLVLPLALLNVFLSAYVCSALWQLRLSLLHPILPLAFVAMFLASWPAIVSTTGPSGRAVLFWFWAFVVYAACLPLMSWGIVVHLLGAPALFERTPKGSDVSRLGWRPTAFTMSTGILGCAAAWFWWSPFSWVALANGSAMLALPVFEHVNSKTSWKAWLACAVLFLPGILWLCGLYAMWVWGRG